VANLVVPNLWDSFDFNLTCSNVIRCKQASGVGSNKLVIVVWLSTAKTSDVRIKERVPGKELLILKVVADRRKSRIILSESEYAIVDVRNGTVTVNCDLLQCLHLWKPSGSLTFDRLCLVLPGRSLLGCGSHRHGGLEEMNVFFFLFFFFMNLSTFASFHYTTAHNKFYF